MTHASGSVRTTSAAKRTMRRMKVSGISSAAGARVLGFDTEHFGVKIGQTDHPDVDRWAEENAVGCLFMLLDTSETDAMQQALKQGFFVTDVRIELEAHENLWRYQRTVRGWEERDLAPLVRIARSSHRITRFYADPHFSQNACDDLYEAWIRNSCAGWASKVLVYGINVPLGYVTIHLDGKDASIGLIAVDEAARGQGIGNMLCASAIAWARAHGAEGVTTVTQARNIAALRMFEGCGFRVEKTGVWMHKHFNV